MAPTHAIYRHLRELRDELVPVPGLAWGEISDGQIVMMMSPSRSHELNAIRLRRQLDRQLAQGLVAATTGDVEDLGLGKLRRPDVLVFPESALEARTAAENNTGIDPREVELAVEIVSESNPDNDYTGKVRDYPAMGIPHYLIIDPRDGTAVHHWHIGHRTGAPAYEGSAPYVFGDRITIGDWTIDTGELVRYPQGGS